MAKKNKLPRRSLHPASEDEPSSLNGIWLWALIVGLSVLVYLPAIKGGFLWDDNAHVTKLDLQSWHGLWRIWSEVGATQQYYPMLHSFFWLQHRLWGEATLGYHLTNVLLHATAAFLLVVVLRRLAIPGARLAALIFVLHPVCVESVAWISEQKNTLSLVFYLLAALAYFSFSDRASEPKTARHSSRPASEGGPPSANTHASAARRSAATYYVLATALFLFALLSKTVTATLPAALLVVFWWKRGWLSWRNDFVPLIPWFGLGAAAGLFSAWVERRYIGAQGADFALDGVQRCLLAGRAIWFYLGKLLWPADLIFIYPRWSIDSGAVGQYFYPLAAVALLAGLWVLRRRWRGPLAGALFFMGSLFPALGFFDVYPFRFSYVADHFQYLASLGIIVPVASVFARWTRAATRQIPARASPCWNLAAAAAICLLGTLTWRQSRIYRDAETLYRTTIEKNPGCWLFDNNLGVIRADAGRTDEAISLYDQALRLNPGYAVAHYNLGNVLLKTGRLQPAISSYEEAVRLDPRYADAFLNLGVALANAGRLSEAISSDDEALRLQPRSAEAHNDLGVALMGSGRIPAAITQYEEALRLKPDYAEAHNDLGYALESDGRLREASGHFEQALRLKPDYAEAQANLANVLRSQGRTEEAISHYRAAVALQPDNVEARNNLGVTLVAVGSPAEAVVQFEEALRLQPNQADIHRNLGVALRAVGRDDEAEAEFKKAAELQVPKARP